MWSLPVSQCLFITIVIVNFNDNEIEISKINDSEPGSEKINDKRPSGFQIGLRYPLAAQMIILEVQIALKMKESDAGGMIKGVFFLGRLAAPKKI